MATTQTQKYQTAGGAAEIPSKRMLGVCVVVVLLVITSALSVVYSSYKSRQLFSEVQQQYAHTLRLEEQWGRLLLEQSTWASHARIEGVAKKQLSMVVPEPTEIVVVKE